ncbi:MAG TPA: hypothetical protein VFR47_10790 [Anaerolineales bacterium]|nr:hypothetical protein [Anaerolineales bacterium]
MIHIELPFKYGDEPMMDAVYRVLIVVVANSNHLLDQESRLAYENEMNLLCVNISNLRRKIEHRVGYYLRV